MGEYHQRGKLDRVFAALGDPTRRAILRARAEHPATINQIAKPFPVSLNTISKQVMWRERVCRLRREITGRDPPCFIDPRPLRAADAWLDHHRPFWAHRPDALEA